MLGEPDVAIVGAGAAGIAAARRLRRAGRSVLLVEAGSRPGGRARTDLLAGLPCDLGCGWLHSADRNPLAALAAGRADLDRSEGAWSRQLDGRGGSDETRARAWAAHEDFLARIRRNPPASDRAADAMEPGDPWTPFVTALSGFMNGTGLDDLSVRDFLAYENASTRLNWRLRDGYGAFLAGLAAGLPISLGARVSAVREDRRVRLETSRGPIEARAAIITVSTSALVSGAIRFDPAAAAHLDAAAALPLGLANKILFGLADPGAVPAESHLLGGYDRARTGRYYLRPFGRPLVEGFLGGVLARDLEAAGTDASVAFAREELAALLGADFARGLTPLAVTAWGGEPGILGSYSHALPGAASARARLAAPVSPRLAFAGEACSPDDFSTAHGAWTSGEAAADHILEGP